MQNISEIAQHEQKMGFLDWSRRIPKLTFHSSWEVKIIPPFGGAMVRFVAYKGDLQCSVYLDCHSNLGAVNEPYWEAYPFQEDTFRCMLDETEKLMFVLSCVLNGIEVSYNKIDDAFDWVVENDVDLNDPEGAVLFKLTWI